jgi:hypothetical protein
VQTLWTDPELCKSTLVRTLHDWWTSNCSGAALPDRGAFDVFAHKDLMASLLISDVEPEPFRIRYRLVGTKIVRNLGVEFTGQYLDDFLGPDHPMPWMDYYRTSYDERRPVLGAATELTAAGGTFSYEFGIFPLALGGDGAVKQFIALEDYFDFELTSGSLSRL